MQINKVLNTVFSARSNIVILRAMINYNQGITGREVSRISGLSPRACLNSLTSLENIGIIIRTRGGRDHLFKINTKHYLFKNAILPLIETEKNFIKSIKKEIASILKNKCHSAYIFGSVARKEDSAESDLDICIVLNQKRDQRKLDGDISELSTELNINYGVTLSPFYITVEDFSKKYKNQRHPVPDILNEGVLIYGDKFIFHDKKN